MLWEMWEVQGALTRVNSSAGCEGQTSTRNRFRFEGENPPRGRRSAVVTEHLSM